jgi:hypothetical protein
MIYNLNDVKVEDENHPTMRGEDNRIIHRTKEQTDFSCIGDNKDIEVYFKNIENIICEKIKKHKYIVGCVAWLTNKKILKELSNKDKEVLIIVQDEDFLRPDTYFDGNKEKFKKTILEYYNKIKKDGTITLGDLGISYAYSPDCGIRRCGFINKNKLPAFPRMHNKFIVLGNDERVRDDDGNFMFLGRNYTEVITGSFNYTENSTNSLENIICVKDKKIVHSYYAQFGEIALISVELDWKGDWNPDESGLRYGS